MFGGYFLSLISITMIPLFNFDIMQFGDFLFIIGISSVSQIGDITISYFKRLSKIKDTGKIIPGHGGLLDRVDGMLFAFHLGWYNHWTILMKKKIAIIGSTGSIGKTTFNIIKK